ncbi:MAG TPA: triose-phosphate isomerase [Saprospiraceae bacterium]|nr:triose-phosphate isomerase [Saprospiraceae bacterium]
MLTRRKMVAANWKMNLTIPEGNQLLEKIKAGLPSLADCDVVIAPPLTHLDAVQAATRSSGMMVGAQNCYFENSGAYTGEVSPVMLSEMGVEYVIAGHSERRQWFAESNEIVRKKVEAILNAGMHPIFCCGEPLEIRQASTHTKFVDIQLEESLFQLPASAMENIIIAYEPIWAIGTGVTASTDQAQEMHAYIRQAIISKYGHGIGDHLRILYGGSIKAENARALFSQRDVDGGLVGGASLQADGFLAILAAACG